MMTSVFGYGDELFIFNIRSNVGYPATTLPLLNEHSTDVKLTVSQASWFASVTAISSPIGGLVSGYFLDRFGRKTTLICINLISIISWLIIAFSSKSDVFVLFVQLMIARIIIGNSFLSLVNFYLNFHFFFISFSRLQELRLEWVVHPLQVYSINWSLLNKTDCFNSLRGGNFPQWFAWSINFAIGALHSYWNAFCLLPWIHFFGKL